MKKKILCTICARSGSKGLKNKNIKKINNNYLFELSIKHAINSKLFDDIILSTDSNFIIQKAKKYKILNFFKRRSQLSTSTIPKVEVIKDAMLKAENYTKIRYDYICDLDVSSPLRKITDIKKSFKKFKNSNADNLFSVTEARKNPYFNMVEKNLDGSIKLCKKKLSQSFTNRQSSPKVYEMNASIYFWKREIILKKNSLFRRNTKFYVMPKERSFDIDDKIDFKIVDRLYYD